MATNFDKDISDFLELAVGGKIEDFDIKSPQENVEGLGFFSDVTFITIANKTTGEDFSLVIKKAPKGERHNSRVLSLQYFNEIQYYTEIFPALQNFQKSYAGVRIFDNFPKCFATCKEKGSEKLAIENLKSKNYEMIPKAVLNPESFEKIFKMYAEFHGLSFAFKHHHPDEFLRITKPLHHTCLQVFQTTIRPYLVPHGKKVEGYLEEEDVAEKFRKYMEKSVDVYVKCLTDQSPHSVILHGDCWSNNMMFKMNSLGGIEDVKMIDFQVGYTGSPALDLSYSFYSSASRESLENLENLLRVYHNTLSDTLKQYGCDANEIYPYEMLEKEWKQFCPFGFLTGILIWCFKDAAKNSDGDVDVNPTNVLNLVRHFYDNDLL